MAPTKGAATTGGGRRGQARKIQDGSSSATDGAPDTQASKDSSSQKDTAYPSPTRAQAVVPRRSTGGQLIKGSAKAQAAWVPAKSTGGQLVKKSSTKANSRDDGAPQPAPSKKRGRTATTAAAVTSEDSGDDDSLPQPVPKKRGRAAKTTNNNGKAKKKTDSGSEGSDDNDGAAAQQTAPKKRGRISKTAAAPQSQPAAGIHTSAAASQNTTANPVKKAKPDPDDDDDDDQQPTTSNANTKQIIIKGRAPVDEHFLAKDIVHVFCEGDDVWDAALNQTSIDNNNNKFYMIQLLEHDQRKEYFVFNRWGRVGKDGQNSTVECGSNLDSAKQAFKKKFREKTKNDWETRTDFEKVPGQYDLVLRDYDAKDEPVGQDVPDTITRNMDDYKIPESKLEARVQSVIKTIFNIKMMEHMVKEMNYDAKKAPLGKLTDAQVKAGYLCLKKIEDLISSGKASSKELNDASSEYYTKIPHDFGMRRPHPISTLPAVKVELDLLETLGDIAIAMRAMDTGKKADMTENPADIHYRTLKMDIKSIERDAGTFRMIEEYLHHTHGPTHSDYQLELLDAFELEKDTPFKDVGNRMLLWHGSRLSNFVGILSQGLRIAPPEAPVTGYMFGKGVYFADVSTKSANYCYAAQSDSVGLMLLCEVALGKSRELEDSDYNADKLPAGFFSTKGVGCHVPDQTTYRTVDDVLVPIGKCVQINNSRGRNNYVGLQYNEYIVYDVAQIRLRYLVQVRFNFKRGRRY